MSTSFEVFPRNHNLPIVRQVLELSTQYLHEYLTSVGVRLHPTVKLEIHNDLELIVVPSPDQALKWNVNEYGWFLIDQVPGGCDAYFEYVDDYRRESWEDEITASLARCAYFADEIRESLKIGHYWHFRRSAGQSAIISLYYGLLAASVAKLTDGFIYSDDGAWDFHYFPIHPDEFRDIYFRSEKTSTDAKWVQKCILAIPNELQMNR